MKLAKKYFERILKNKFLFFALIIFIFAFFLRAYQMDIKNPFGYDQVDNAWAAKNLIVNHKLPLVGMVAKADSGVYIGPAYYYLVAFFYWVFNLNPFASQILSLLSGIFNLLVIYFVVREISNKKVALIAVIINAFNFYAIIFDRIQWPVQLLPAVSFLSFLFLYKVVLGNPKYLIPLAITVGVAFNLHFTAIFLLLIILLSLPIFPKTKETTKYILISLPLFLAWLIPNFLYMLVNKSSNAAAGSYFSSYYHGFHLRRMLQLSGDAFIQFDQYIFFNFLKPLKFIIFPLFIFVYLYKSLSLNNKKFIYLLVLWFIVPWIVFTTYSGEISDYYFSVNKFIVLFILSYIIYLCWNVRFFLVKLLVAVLLTGYSLIGITTILQYKDPGSFLIHEQNALQKVNMGERIEFAVGVPESYLYYYYMRQKGVEVYVSKTK